MWGDRTDEQGKDTRPEIDLPVRPLWPPTQRKPQKGGRTMLNKVTLIGNLGKDPEVRYAANGTAICNLSLATSEKWKDKNTGEQKEATEWHRLSAFGKQAEILSQYCQKGSRLYVEGSIRTRKWQDNDGNDRYSTEIKVSEFKFLSGQNEGSAPASQPQQQQPQQQQQEQPDYSEPCDDIPF